MVLCHPLSFCCRYGLFPRRLSPSALHLLPNTFRDEAAVGTPNGLFQGCPRAMERRAREEVVKGVMAEAAPAVRVEHVHFGRRRGSVPALDR